MANHGKRALALIFAALLVAAPAFAQSIATQANSVFRDYNTPGNALSGIYNPPKADVRSLFGLVDTQIPHTADPHTWAATQTFSFAPVFSDPSGTRSALGLGALATLNAPPAPTTSVLGGVLSLTCSTNQFVNSVNSSGVPTCATPTTGSSTTAAGSSGQFQTNSSGSLAGVSITGAVSISGTTGVSTLAAGQAVANLGYTPVNKAGDIATGPVAFIPSAISTTNPPITVLAPTGVVGNATTPSTNLGLQMNSSGSSSGWVPFWNGVGNALNRVDVSSGGAIGQGRIHAPVNYIWSDTIDNGTSDGSVNDPHSGTWGAHQPSNGINTVSLQYLEQNIHAGFTGVRETLRVNTIVDGTPAVWNVNNNIVGVRDRVSILANQGGSTGAVFANAKGAAFAYNPEVFLASGATDLLEVALMEGNIGINTGASARMLFGATMVKNSQKFGDVLDAAFEIGAGGSGTVPWQDGILITDVHGIFPVNTTGSILRIASNFNGGTPSILNGIDISAATITGAAFKSPGFQVTGTGGIVQSSMSGGGAKQVCVDNSGLLYAHAVGGC